MIKNLRKWQLKELTGSATLKWTDIGTYGLFVVTASATVTLPSPISAYRGHEIKVLNQHSGSITLSCTGKFPRSGDSITLTTGQVARLEVEADGSGAYCWHAEYQAAISGVPAAVGGMVTGNTETGIAVTYQSADDTLDFVVAYGTTASTACQGNDARLLATAEATMLAGSLNWNTYDPNPTWDDAAPGSVTEVGRYMRIGDLIIGNFQVSGADGDGKTLTAIAVPVTVKDVNAFVPFAVVQLDDTTYTHAVGEVDASTPGTIVFRGLTACTDNVAFRISGMFMYEVA
jgi:hypothetical protein